MTHTFPRISPTISRRSRTFVLVAILLFASCATAKRDITAPGARRQLDLPVGGYQHLAWLPSGWIVADYEDDVTDIEFRLSAFRQNGEGFHRLPFTDDNRCRVTRYSIPQRLPDGRLGLTKECVGPEGSNVDATVSYLAYDIEADKTETLATVAPTWGRDLVNGALVGDENPESASWDAGLDTAVISTGGLCSTLAKLTSRGFSDLPVKIRDGKRSWRLDEQLHADPSASCSARGRANYPTWSRNDEIAFFASPQSIGVGGPDRVGLPANLYGMKAGDWKPRELLSDVESPTSLEWSPDGKWLVFTAGNRERAAIWLFEAQTKMAKRVLGGPVAGATWSPDGLRLAVIETLELEEGAVEPKAKVSILDVSDVVDR